MNVVAWREFTDHHAYTRRDVDDLATHFAGSGAAAAVCTQKDLVKVQLDRLGRMPLWAMAIETELLAGGEELLQHLQRLTESNPANAPLPAS
jgi:tetraacyldisaccharide-1-P 4'-kinase